MHVPNSVNQQLAINDGSWFSEIFFHVYRNYTFIECTDCCVYQNEDCGWKKRDFFKYSNKSDIYT